MIVFVTAGVIVLTLLHGLALPAVARWARLPADTALEAERQLAVTVATEEVLASLPRLAEQLGTGPDAAERLRQEYENRLLNGSTTRCCARYRPSSTSRKCA